MGDEFSVCVEEYSKQPQSKQPMSLPYLDSTLAGRHDAQRRASGLLVLDQMVDSQTVMGVKAGYGTKLILEEMLRQDVITDESVRELLNGSQNSLLEFLKQTFTQSKIFAFKNIKNAKTPFLSSYAVHLTQAHGQILLGSLSFGLLEGLGQIYTQNGTNKIGRFVKGELKVGTIIKEQIIRTGWFNRLQVQESGQVRTTEYAFRGSFSIGEVKQGVLTIQSPKVVYYGGFLQQAFDGWGCLQHQKVEEVGLFRKGVLVRGGRRWSDSQEMSLTDGSEVSPQLVRNKIKYYRSVDRKSEK